jgi:hypothetical protein
MNFLRTLHRILFPADLDAIFSEESKERTAVLIAARFSRGNTGVQGKRVTTDRKFAAELRRMEQRVAQHPSLSY